MTPAERSRRYRDKVRGGPPRPYAQPVHGQRSGIAAHERAHEDLCPECRAERSRINAENYQRRKERG